MATNVDEFARATARALFGQYWHLAPSGPTRI